MDKIVQDILARHDRRASLVTILKEVQDEYSCLPQDAMIDIARSLNITPGEVYEVATFYSFLSPEPLGENVIRICKSTTCFLKNGDTIVEALGKELGIGIGETTEDGKFSLHLTNCIGACDKAPAMMINKKTYGNLTPEKVAKILNEYRA